jgi:leucyl aminopeptidase (aminopeptidase T)
MLTDEGALGCVHFGLGSNYTVGGLNKVDFHLDFVFRDASLSVDGKQLINLGVPLL